jgi:hypothetical protein
MAAIKVQYVGNEDGYAIVRYGGKLYYCNPNALSNNLITNSWYSINHTELFQR